MYEGNWYPGSIYVARDGKYKVLRDNYTSDDRWFTIDDLKRAPIAVPAAPALAGLPASVSRGTYTCGTLLSGSVSGNQMGMTLGTITIADNGSYTGLAKEGKGLPSRFSYDAATGRIDWKGGRLAGFFAMVVESSFSRDNRGRPLIRVTYRVREGGNLFTLECQSAAIESKPSGDR
jgi:hypothetical protein